MNVEYKDFIGAFTNVFPEGFCEHLISEFERNKELGAGSDRQKREGAHKHHKNDYSIHSNVMSFSLFNGDCSVNTFFKGLQHCFDVYGEEYSSLKQTKINCNNLKMQKTSSGGGYHIWHCEQGSGLDATRVLVYMLYLNTLPIEANGETEFLYQQRRISPVKNTMVLWPAAFTHAHRGNPVYGDAAKYIATGWFYAE